MSLLCSVILRIEVSGLCNVFEISLSISKISLSFSSEARLFVKYIMWKCWLMLFMEHENFLIGYAEVRM